MIRQDSKSIIIAGTAIFSALVTAIEYLSLAVPLLRISFLPLPYLKFDLAEIPAALSYFVFGLPVGVTTSLLVPLTIIARGTSNPIGAWIKGLAVLSTIIGFAPLATKNKIIATVTGILSRVLIMTIVNMALFGANTGVLALTGIFNLIHACITLGGAFLIYHTITPRISQLLSMRSPSQTLH